MSGAEMDLAPVIIWAAGLSTLLSLVITVWNLVTSGARSNSKLLSQHTSRIDAVERRTDQLESRIEQTPSRDMMHDLQLSMARIDGELGKMNERLKPVQAIVDRIQELMLSQGK